MRDAMRLAPTSSTNGDPDVLSDLERDHREVEQLFARASLNAGADRMAVIPDIVRALTVHAAVEEQVVYPAIAAAVGGGDVLADRAVDEHRQMEELLARLDGADADGPDVVADLRSLQLVVQAHVAVEEGELFPAYREQATPEQLAQLTDEANGAREDHEETTHAR